ncbi:hypothetical protein KC19_VG240700 [Ceratodon purpureus]|uniref:Uncharacterized protein n=1 Tax=Ceratodon purpureus TaxID=3225 RepID=A0A8T0HTW6_CERPU|nr:hypothetical protein KC19_VG240700 [Ceratodon purpureus]
MSAKLTLVAHFSTSVTPLTGKTQLVLPLLRHCILSLRQMLYRDGYPKKTLLLASTPLSLQYNECKFRQYFTHAVTLSTHNMQ